MWTKNMYAMNLYVCMIWYIVENFSYENLDAVVDFWLYVATVWFLYILKNAFIYVKILEWDVELFQIDDDPVALNPESE